MNQSPLTDTANTADFESLPMAGVQQRGFAFGPTASGNLQSIVFFTVSFGSILI